MTPSSEVSGRIVQTWKDKQRILWILEEFNHCVAQDRRYPITITFYQDEEWSELQDLIDDLRDDTQGKSAGRVQ